MSWLIDGSNVLGAARVDLHSEDAKRALMQRIAAFARARRTRVTCFFDGQQPNGFATQLGALQVRFTASRTADDCITDAAAVVRNCHVVTSDRGLHARVRRRGVEVISSRDFLRLLEAGDRDERDSGDEWETYFSDPKNRLSF